MNISSDFNSIYFGQKIPTSSFLKMGSGIFEFEAAKNLCHTFDERFPGHIGYYQKALHYVEMIEQKNPNMRNILKDISYLKFKDKKLNEIEKLTKELGEEIDVVI